MSRLNEFIGKFEVIIDGKKLELKPQKEDKWAIMELQKVRGERMSVEDNKKLNEVLTKILKQSIPDASDEEIDSFLVQYSEELLMELGVAFRWLTREQLEKIRKDFLSTGMSSQKEKPKKNSEQD